MENVAAKGFHLSPQQRRLWPLTQRSTAYRAQCVVRVEGDLDVAALRRAWQLAVDRHEALRTTFYRRPGMKVPFQVIADGCEPAWRHLDLRADDPGAQEAAVGRALTEEGERAFDFGRESLLRLCLVRLAEREHLLLVSLPVLCADARTLGNLLRESARLYGRPAEGAGDDDEPLQYADFSEWQNELLETEDELAERGRAYWRALRERLAAAPPARLPLETGAPGGGAVEPAVHALTLEPGLAVRLAGWAAAHETTPELFLLACWQTLLWRHTRQAEVVVGVLFDGRKYEGMAEAVGLFAKTLPVVCRFEEGVRFIDVLRLVGSAAAEADEWQNYFDEGELTADGEAGPLIGFEFAEEVEPQEAGGVRMSLALARARLDRCRLSLSLSSSPSSLRASLLFDPSSFSHAAAAALADQFRTLLRSALDSPSSQAALLRSLSPEAEAALLRLSSAPPPSAAADDVDADNDNADDDDAATVPAAAQFLHRRFERQAATHPDRTALVCGSASLSYAELNERANRLARLLRSRGAGPEGVVALLVGRGPEAIVSLLAAWKAGGAYLPLEPTLPAARLRLMLCDSGARLLVAGSGMRALAESLLAPGEEGDAPDGPEQAGGEARADADGYAGGPAEDEQLSAVVGDAGLAGPRPAPPQLVALDQEETARLLSTLDCSDLPPDRLLPANLSYVLFTSGSTGRPKAVAVEHRQVSNYVAAVEQRLGLPAGSSFASVSTLAADLGHTALFPALCGGGTLHLVGQEEAGDGAALSRYMAAHGVDCLKVVPTHLRALLGGVEGGGGDEGGGVLPRRVLVLGGEASTWGLVREAVRRGAEGLRVLNHYGPTEATVGALTYEAAPAAEAAWAGGPSPSPEGWVPLGYVLGGVRAYVLDGQMRPTAAGETGEVYLGGAGVARGYVGRAGQTAERFVPDVVSGEAGARLYRTGDRGRYGAGWEVEFGGRADGQVKVRGYRVELGEVEAAVRGHAGVRECAVVALSGGEGVGARLACYYAGEGVGSEEVREWLEGRLPEYMVPWAVMEVRGLPRTANGKVDLKALPAPEQQLAHSSADAAPRSPTEEILTNVFADVLGLPRVGVDDNFFDLGGHSLLATQLVARLREIFKVEVVLRNIFEAPTAAGLAAAVEAQLSAEQGLVAPPLTRRMDADAAAARPLSYAQQRLWFLDQLEPGSPFYNIHAAVRLRGLLDLDALGRALSEVARRHESLRTTFEARDGRPAQVVAPPSSSLPVEVRDLSGVPAGEREGRMAALLREAARRPFDLGAGPLLRAEVVREGEGEHVVLLTMHHIVSDGWSMGVLVREVAALYGAYAEGGESPLEELPLQYADYAVWQRGWLRGEVLERQLDYWRGQLAGAPPVLELPTDYTRPAVLNSHGARKYITLDEGLVSELKALSRREGVTLFMTLLAAFQTLLHRYTGEEDIVVGSPVAGRTHRETEGLIGFFVNTLVLRTRLSARQSFRELLRQTRGVALDAYAHQDVPFEKLVEELQPERRLGHTPLFQVMFILQNAPMGELDLPGLEAEMLPVDSGTAKFDLTLSLEEEGDGLVAVMEYNTDLFAEATVERMLAHYRTLLRSAVAEPDRLLSDLRLLAEDERRRLLVEWNETAADFPRDSCLQHLFERQARLSPHSLAASSPTLSLSYSQLNARANRLAHRLLSLGAAPDRLVAILLGRSTDALVSLLAVLKSGAAYLPLDPAHPQARLSFVLAEARPCLVISSSALAGLLPESPAPILLLDQEEESLASFPDHDPEAAASPDNLAYVLYTSGSTGTPKGVMIPHRGLVNYLCWAVRAYGAGEGRGALVHSPLTFDLTVTSLLSPLLAGSAVFLVPEGEGVEGLGAALRAGGGFSLLKVTPAHLEVLGRWLPGAEAAGKAGALVIGGEALTGEALSYWRRHAPETRLINEYGPTETVVGCCAYEVEEGRHESGAVPIGRPIANAEMYVLDGEMGPVPVGVSGELYIGGEGLGRGYLGRPGATAERFVPHPYSVEPGARLYRTGDVGRRLEGGDIEYLGRNDAQVKVRGYRVELGEVEAGLAGCEGVREAAVVARGEGGGDRRLVAYVVFDEGSESGFGRVREALKRRLPEYMVPSLFVEMESLPLTANGKVDRKALPAPDQGQSRGGGEYRGPRTPAEEMLCEVWSEVLKVGRVGIDDNFFELGGHSLLATQVVSRVRAIFEVELAVRSLFERPTVRGLAESVEALLRGGARAEAPPLKAVPRDVDLPLSYAQQRLWFLDQLEPGSPFYNIPATVRLGGALDIAALGRALSEVVRRHEALRTTFEVRGGQPVQVVAEAGPVPLPLEDLSGLSGEELEAEVRRLAAAEARRPFDLGGGALLRASLLKLSDDEHVLLLTMHHIITDGWSVGVLVREMAALYEAYTEGRESPLAELPLQYADYAVWQREWLTGEVLERQLDYWRGQLAGAPPVLELPTDRPRPAVQSYRGGQERFRLGEELTGRLQEASRREGVTLFMTLLAAFQTLLHRYTGAEDVVVGTDVSNRNQAGTEELIGFFVNQLVLRTDLSGDPTLAELLRRVREVSLDAYAHQDVPFERLVEVLNPERSLNTSPLFQVKLVLQNTPAERLALPGLELGVLGVESGAAKFDTTLVLTETPGGIEAVWEYSTDLFEAGTIRRMWSHLERLLEAFALDAGRRLSELTLLAPEEERLLLSGWNETAAEYPRESCVHELFEKQAAHTPDAVALAFDGGRLTYAELNRRANQLAHYLRRSGVGPEALVGVMVERSADLFVCLLGVLKAGGAYLPLDPEYPLERLSFMLEDAGVSALVTQEKFEDALPSTWAQVISLDADRDRLALESTDDPAPSATAENLAYVLYTSGSTGRPKGVAVTHRAVVRLVRQDAYASFGPAETFLQLAPVSFDASTFEIWGSLLNGGRLAVMPPEKSSLEELGRALRRHQVTTLWLTAGLFQQMVDERLEDLGGLRQLLAGGDVLPVPQVERVLRELPGCRLINGYGPTESTTFACCHVMTGGRAAGGSVPIGRPIANTRVYLLDERLRPVPIGVAGDLYIAGDGLARGYLKRAALTAERFIPDHLGAEAGGRLYRTGDRARYLPDSSIEFLGRADGQVKVRGFRIELGEVEAALLSHPALSAATVVLSDDGAGKGSPADRRLLAYYVARPESAIEAAELRQHLRQRLPEYMLPSAFTPLQALPLTPNGKVDRRALPAPETGPREAEAREPARGATEELLAGIWGEVLRLGEVGRGDNFFELGGHSLLATQVVSRVRSIFGVEVSLRSLFERPTVEGFAAAVEEAAREEQGIKAPPLARREVVEGAEDGGGDESGVHGVGWPLSYAQQRLWFLDQLEPGSPFYNIPAAVRLSGALDAAALGRALSEVVRRHESLRTSFRVVAGEPVQVVAEAGPVPVAVLDLSGLSGEERDAAVRREAAAEARRPFDLGGGALLRASLLKLSDDEHVLLLTMHHIVSDGWSMGVLIREMTALYEAYAEGGETPLPELPLQYADYAVWQRGWLRGEVLEQELSYWRRQLAGAPPVLELPTDRPRPAVQSYRGGQERFRLGEELTGRLQEASRREGVTLFMTLLAAFQTLLHRYTGAEDIVVGSPVAGRTHRETEGLIGFFVNTLVLRTDLSRRPRFRELLARVRETCLGAYAHQDVPFEKLVEELRPERKLNHSPLFQVAFGVENTPAEELRLPGLGLEMLKFSGEAARFDLTLWVTEQEGGLSAHWSYSTDLFDAETVARMNRHYVALLQSAVAAPDARVDALDMRTEEEKERLLAQESEWDAFNVGELTADMPEAVTFSEGDLVEADYLEPGRPLPLLLRPRFGDVDLAEWARNNRDYLEEELARHGAILFRDFGLDSPEEFGAFVGSLAPELMGYAEPSTPRTDLGGGLYTSTEYDAAQNIPLHNELSYSHRWPLKVWFFCQTPAAEGGETPLADCRRVYEYLDPALRERLTRRRVLYVRNFGDGLGLPWQEVFRTSDRAEVEEYCRRAGAEFEWRGGDRLRTRQVREAALPHPRTGETVWFNQAHLHQLLSLEPAVREALLAAAEDPAAPLDINAYYGDGEPLAAEEVAAIAEAYRRATVTFEWRRGDVLMVDNMLVAHGRRPFAGPRKVLVAMAEPCGPGDPPPT